MTVKEYRELLKKRHLCRDCKTQDAYTLAGRTYCFDCAEKQRIAKEKARTDPIKREKMRRQLREHIERYRADNKCIRCGMQSHNGKSVCDSCLANEKTKYRTSSRYSPRIYGVICWQCNRAPCADGKKLCQSCYEKKVKTACENLKKADMKNHPWRKEDYRTAQSKSRAASASATTERSSRIHAR